MKSRLFLALLVLIIGIFVPMNPASTWTSGEQIAGAPPTQLGPDELVDARRAAGEANTQTGFLTTGTEDLADGAEDLRDGMIDLADGAEDARQGASDLAVGMNSLQGGMGELGSGANSVADGVGTAVDTVVGFEAIKGQIIAAIDRTLDGTNGATDQQVIDARDALTGLRGDVEVAQLPEDTVTQLNELKDGSREVANQLTLEGYGFYDGMVAATGGANTLSTGMVDLRDGANTARDGAQELYDGAEKVDTIAGNTKDKVDAVQRAIPAASPMTVAEGAEEVPDSALSPTVAMLIAALMVLGGVALAVAGFVARGSRWTIIGAGSAFLTIIGLILVMVLGVGLSPAAMALITVTLALAALGSAGLTWIFLAAFGPRIGAAVAALLSVLQVGVVGWVWKAASFGEISTAWQMAAGFMPLNWATTSLSAAGNGGSEQSLWIGLLLSAALAVVGMVAVWRGALGNEVADGIEETEELEGSVDETAVIPAAD